MKTIQTVGIVGLGALGVLFTHQFTEALGREHVKVLADEKRTARYRKEGVYFNDVLCDFNYVDAGKETEPVDLLMFAVKFGGLENAISECRHLVGPDTIILSVLNGIASEQVLGDAFGPEKLVWCVAQKMSALKEGNRAVCRVTGELAVGVPSGYDTTRLKTLTDFFDRIHFAYSLPEDIRFQKWSKLMINTGCNQSAMVYECPYGTLQQPGEARDTMIAAMQEVMQVADAEGTHLAEKDLDFWMDVIDHMDPTGEPSMRQDGKAHRRSEVELFAGTIRRLAAKHGISVPVNDLLYQRVKGMESSY